MTSGLDHFDGSDRETFAAALILVCIEEDPSFRSLICNLVRHSARMPDAGAALIAWGREEALVVGPAQRRRSDIWLRFEDGVVLVEIKTHSRWIPADVAKQISDQGNASLGGERVRHAVLLAPGLLLRRLSAYDIPKLLWLDVLRAADNIEQPSRVVQLARVHWSQNVETDFGLPASTTVMPLDTVAAQAGCLVALLRAAIIRMGGKVKETVWFSSPDGRPRRQGSWAWIGIAVSGRLPGIGDVYVGVYTYSDGPPDGALGTFIEAYRAGDDHVPLVSVPFAPRDFSPESLNTILEEFGAAFEPA